MKFKEAVGLRRITGLMFRTSNTTPLIFKFDRDVTRPIHSFFVFFPFEARWYDSNHTLITQKTISPFTARLKPHKPYRVLAEIPITDERRME